MRHGRRLAIAAIATTIGVLAGAQGASAAIFYAAESGSIGRIDLDGANQVDELIDVPTLTRAVVATSTHVYWAESGALGRANLDGSGANPDFVTGGTSSHGLAADATHLYWSDTAAGTIRRANRATGVLDAGWSVTGAGTPRGVAVDGTYVYWIDAGTGRIARAPIDDPAAWSYLTGVVGAQYGIAVDGSYLYYGTPTSVGRVALDGSGAGPFITSPNAVFGIAVDAQHVYWVTLSTRLLRRADIADGGDATTLATLPLGAFGVSLGPAVGRLTLTAPAFANTVQGQTSGYESVTVTNTGEAALTLDDIALTGADADQFEVNGSTCAAPIAVDGSCTVSVRFAPTSAGPKSAALQVSSPDADVSPKSVALSATALGLPAVSFGAAPTFPDQLAGTTGPSRTVTITNGGGSPLTVSGVSLTGGDAASFELVSQTCTAAPIAAAGTCEAVVRFAPGSSGAKGASLRVASDAQGSPDDLALAATALAGPSVTFGAAPTFPDQLVGTTGPDRTVTITNGGDAPLTVSGVTITGPDAGAFGLVSQTCTAAPIAAAGTCAAVIRFAPGTPGAKAAALRITGDAASSPDDLALGAVATAIPLAPPPVLSALSPSSGSEGTSVLIEGSWLGGARRVLFGDADAARFEVLGFDRIVAIAPAGIPESEVVVRVVGPGGTSEGLAFSYAPTPAPAPVLPLPPAAVGARCVVPDVVGDPRRAARRALRAAGCALGAVKRPERGRGRLVVKRQTPRAGKVLAAGAEVDVRLSRPGGS